jgi:hypothetical protein
MFDGWWSRGIIFKLGLGAEISDQSHAKEVRRFIFKTSYTAKA